MVQVKQDPQESRRRQLHRPHNAQPRPETTTKPIRKELLESIKAYSGHPDEAKVQILQVQINDRHRQSLRPREWWPRMVAGRKYANRLCRFRRRDIPCGRAVRFVGEARLFSYVRWAWRTNDLLYHPNSDSLVRSHAYREEGVIHPDTLSPILPSRVEQTPRYPTSRDSRRSEISWC